MIEHDDLYSGDFIETVDEALTETRVRANILSKGKDMHSITLAQRLYACADGEEDCGSLACKCCVRVIRLEKTQQVLERTKGLPYKFMTIIFYKDVLKIEDLKYLNPRKLKDRLRKQLKRAGVINAVFGMLEVDYHPEVEQWLPHFHILISEPESVLDNLTLSLNKSCNIDSWKDKIPRPTRCDDIKKRYWLITYIYKVMWMTVYSSSKFRGRHDVYRTSLRYLDSVSFSTICIEFNAG